MSSMAKLFDVFFNGRPAETPKSKVTIEELIRRKVCYVVVDRKLYRVEVKEAKIADS